MTINVILGAGVAGLAAAYEARRMGRNAVIYEARRTAGGLLDNFKVGDFRFDQAVHLSFATETEVRDVFDKSAYHTHLPEAVNWDRSLWLRHPVQNNMSPLQTAEKVELIAGLAEAPTIEVNTYEDWLITQYGEPIARRWPMTYTEKYWTLPASRLGTEWIGQRIRRADLREVLAGAFTEDTPNVFYAKEMRYPEEGGYRKFITPMIETADIRTEMKATRICPTRKDITFANGEIVHYDRLISTLPLPVLISLIPEPPAEIASDAESLFATSIDLISVGFNRPKVSPTLWFYIYDIDIFAARAYAPDWKSLDNVPPGCSSLQFEIYSSRERPMQHSVEELKRNTIDAILKMGLAREDEILFVHHRRLPYGNVVFDLGMEERRDRVLRWVREQGIEVAGRFGEWAYLWSNQSMMSGLQAARAAFGRMDAQGRAVALADGS